METPPPITPLDKCQDLENFSILDLGQVEYLRNNHDTNYSGIIRAILRRNYVE
jgi:hypothetical protein